ncbi:Eco57I restriction-modification methylase domain-containing protein [Nostoc sp. PA-18-2419]|uniref:Eco57I restriction-modification methylase domain-containing protein n=1 Tax=Nostoc sp. PA-18-2419 TaxID=2575443 RepID=UPI001109B294|nr:TaqI-like C-terminal specificity domain-containing protein [Nostoc sp. PA-18-2419]
MAGRLLQLDDVRHIDSPQNVASLFQKIGYNASAQQLAIDDLELPSRSAEAIWNAYMIADHQHGSESLQVLLFQLHDSEWHSNSVASNRMRSLAQSLCRRPSNFLLLGTKNYDQLMLVNPRKNFDADLNLKVSIRKLLIDRANPTNYDRDRLDAIAARNLSPQELYKVQCEAFDVEKLTKEFYRGYREIFEELQRVIKANNPHSYFTDPNRLHQFSQRLLGRIMFLYFLQKKEFLAGDRNFLKNQYKRLRSDLENTDFYTQVLEPLFFEMLNKQRPNMDSPWGKIPYLNGGLFDRDYGTGVIDAAGVETPPQIELPNSLFDPSGDKGILRFFNSYNFTVSENVQGDEDAAVDPEMLGKVFENMLASEERGQSGTFYTPRGIVQFMCVESLSRYLADQTGMDLEAVKKLTEYDPELPGQDINQLLTKEQAKKLKKALDSVKICDPAVGSGAFPMGMMQVILSVKQAIAHRTDGRPVQRGSLTISQWKRDIIANNLYGVDIKPEAVEIGKLRMWLSLVVDIPDIDDVEPLPNLDYKLMCGDSLISTIQGEQLIPDPTKDQQTMLNVTPIQSAIQPLVDLQHQYFEAHAEERKILRGKILEAEKNVFRVALADRIQYWQIEQDNLEQDIRRLKGKASKTQTQKQQTIKVKLQELGQIAAEVERGMRSLNFFQWHLHFNDVFQQQGGFDIVIGNPPYLKIQSINKEQSNFFKKNYVSATGKFDIYVLFVEKSFDLIKPEGRICYIHPHKFLTADYGQGLKKFLENIKGVNLSILFGVEQIFDSATTYSGIFIYSFNNEIFLLKYSNTLDLDREKYTKIKYEKNSLPWRLLSTGASNLKNDLLDNITSQTYRLKYILEGIYQGTVTGANNIFVISGNFQGEYFEGFSHALGHQVKLESGIVKPILLGENIRRYQKPTNDSVVFYAYYQNEQGKTQPLDENSLKAQYPYAYAYINNFKQILINKKTKYKTNPRFWFTLHRGREINIFEREKILTPQLQNYPSFTLDLEGWYADGGYCLILKEEVNIEYKFLLGILNSSVLWFFIKNTSHPYNNNYFYFKTKYLEPFSIPTAPKPDRLAIEALVQKCLDAKGQAVKEWEAEIDDRVAHLYGLTAEEMKIIRGE